MKPGINLWFIFLLGGCLLICTSGAKERNRSYDPHIKDISIKFSNSKKNYKFSELFNHLEIVPLETNQKSLIGEITDIKVTDKRIYVLDIFSAKGLMVFARGTGKFLFKIASEGKGPGEFDMALDFAVDPVTSNIYIKSSKKILIYDSEGKFLREKILDFLSSNVKTDGRNLFAFLGSGNEPELIVTDNSFKDTISYFKKSFRSIMSTFRLQYVRDRGIMYWREIDYTMYHVKKKSLEKFIKIHFPDTRNVESLIQKAVRKVGMRNMTFNEFLASMGGVSINAIFLGKNYALIAAYYKKEPYMSVYNYVNGNYILLNYKSIVDDLSGNMANIYIHRLSDNDELIFSVQPMDITDESASVLKEVKKNISNDANPIIVIGSLKKI